MTQLNKWMIGGKISKLVVVITDKDTSEVVERWQFDVCASTMGLYGQEHEADTMGKSRCIFSESKPRANLHGNLQTKRTLPQGTSTGIGVSGNM